MTSYLVSRLALPHIRFENATCGRRFFSNKEKHLRFRKYPGYVWMVKYSSKTLHVGADFFLNTEGKENTRLRVLMFCVNFRHTLKNYNKDLVGMYSFHVSSVDCELKILVII